MSVPLYSRNHTARPGHALLTSLEPVSSRPGASSTAVSTTATTMTMASAT
nr:hypothetical protein [Kibdelosporangium sp. MJ126-NF4]